MSAGEWVPQLLFAAFCVGGNLFGLWAGGKVAEIQARRLDSSHRAAAAAERERELARRVVATPRERELTRRAIAAAEWETGQ